MTLSRDFNETVTNRLQHDPDFARALLDEAVTLLINGEADTARVVLRDLITATMGFETLAQEIHKPVGSLHKMLSHTGEPTMSTVSLILAAITRALRVNIHTSVVAV